MFFARLLAVVLLLQGLGPTLLLGWLRPGGWFLAALAAIYAVSSVGVWYGRRWGSVLAFALTSPQLLVISSSWYSWRFYSLASGGYGFAFGDTLTQGTLLPWKSFGAGLDWASGYTESLLTNYASAQSPSFVLVNFVALTLYVLLIIHAWAQWRAAKTVPASRLARSVSRQPASGRWGTFAPDFGAVVRG